MDEKAIVTIAEQEQALIRCKAEAAAEIKARIAAAKEAGKQAVQHALTQANAELEALRESVDQTATAEAREKLQNTENRKAVLRARADKVMDEAANYIVERIVAG